VCVAVCVVCVAVCVAMQTRCNVTDVLQCVL